MITLTGIALSPGVARGAAVTIRSFDSLALAQDRPVGESVRTVDDRPAQEQFRSARRDAAADLQHTLDSLSETDRSACEILRAHLTLLLDPMLTAAVESRIVDDGTDAHTALEQAAAELASRFETLTDPVMRQRAADLRDVCECISRHLTGWASPVTAARGSQVICAKDLSPAQVIRLAQDCPAAFVLEHGSETSHAAILMRALAVPAVIGVPDVTALVKDDDLVLVDGNRGRVVVGPEADASLPATAVIPMKATDSQPASTSDGIAIAVTATIADAEDARRAMIAGADGIGLFRTEMLFLRSEHLPSEETQEKAYREVCSVIGSRPLTMRLLDLGADKQARALKVTDEPNPALGLRGVRLLLARPELLRPHLRALLRAGAGRRVRLLVPMAVDAADIVRIRELIEQAASGLASTALAVDVGVMIETPAAAVMAEELAAVVEFISIGTNDLAQYVLAADRDSARMASFYQPLHPAVLRLMRGVIAAARRRGISVSVCGEAAADGRAVPLFVGMGVTELSVRPSAVAAVKAQVRRISRQASNALAEEVLALPTAIDVVARIDAHAAETGLDVRETCNPR